MSLVLSSAMDFDGNREACDSGPRFDATTISTGSPGRACGDSAADAASKSALRLELADVKTTEDADGQRSNNSKSPMSPMSNSSKTGVNKPANLVHSSTQIAGVQKEVIDDRKALRDALYQGIFHRHRRTIFAMGSFIRMLKSRNSQYNTIRSASDGEDETR